MQIKYMLDLHGFEDDDTNGKTPVNRAPNVHSNNNWGYIKGANNNNYYRRPNFNNNNNNNNNNHNRFNWNQNSANYNHKMRNQMHYGKSE
jgi:hypothetical protein